MKNSPKNISEYFKMVFYLQGSDKERDKVIINKGDDPYFYDAYQGIKDIDIQERKQIIANLNEKINAKVKANRKFGLPFFKVAAGMAILAGLTFWMFNISESKKQVVFSPGQSSDNKVALQKESILESDESGITDLVVTEIDQAATNDADLLNINPSTPTVTEPLTNNTTTSESIVSAPPPAVSGIAQGTPATKVQAQNSDPIIRYETPDTRIFYENSQQPGDQTTRPSQTNPQGSKKNTSVADVASARSTVPTKTTTQSQSRADASAEKDNIINKLDQSESANQRKRKRKEKLVGYVRDNYGNPLFGVTVIAEESMNGTSTDMDGKFELDGLIKGEPLVFKSIGYEDVNQNYDGTSTLKVNLKNTVELSEVVISSPAEEEQIVSENTTKANGFLSNQSNQNLKFAKPASGWKTFKSIIEKNKRYPSEAIENDISGRVIISFFVDVNGQLSDFQVKKSLGYGCDEEAIRLLKNGPPWDAGATDTRAEYTFRFK